jgi:hypothetical protein
MRPGGSNGPAGSYIEIGGDADQRVYFERQGGGPAPPEFESPLNLYSDTETRIAVIIEFNQPVNPSNENISGEFLELQYLDASGAWQSLQADIELTSNCVGGAATVRIQPIGVLPPSSRVRANVKEGFEDITRNKTTFSNLGFISWATRRIAFESLQPPDELADGFVENFDFDNFRDDTALFVSPPAVWDGGKLKAGFDFEGDGGPGGAFDWVVDGLFRLNTISSTIASADMTRQQTVVNGIVNVRNLTVLPDAVLDIVGPNPARIRATGDVIIRGTIDISGNNGRDVSSINTGDQVEVGALGNGGSGKGGNASEITTNSTPRGGTGGGPFDTRNLGGQGGETGYSSGSVHLRRPGGGGGGRFQQDALLPEHERADKGVNGHSQGTGAVSMSGPAQGGDAGLAAFVDEDPTNNYWGLRPVVDERGNLVEIVRGELRRLWAGSGGGAGGDAIPRSSFLTNNWGRGSDEKGGPGGSGGGGLTIQALGSIVFGVEGLIRSNGGRGGIGESTNQINHVGGTGGSGSGGHVVLESATQIDFTDGGTLSAAGDHVQALGAPGRRGPDANHLPEQVSHGGPGGAGVIQLHVPDPIDPIGPGEDSAIRLPLAAFVEEDPLDAIASPRPVVLIPTFGPRSQARSRWIPMAGADQDPNGGTDLLRFRFGGTEADGSIAVLDETVQELEPLLRGTLGEAAAIGRDGTRLILQHTEFAPLLEIRNGLSNDLYLRTPALLEGFLLRLQSGLDPQLRRDFVVTDAVYDEGRPSSADEVLLLETGLSHNGVLADFQPPGAIDYELIPRFFRVVTDGIEDYLPQGSSIRIRFEATGADARGLPDTENLLVEGTPDIALFNRLAPGELSFFRFEIDFRLVEDGTPLGPDSRPVGLDFLKVPFVF